MLSLFVESGLKWQVWHVSLILVLPTFLNLLYFVQRHILMLFIALSDKQEELEEHTCRFQMCRNIAFTNSGYFISSFLTDNVQAAARKKCNFELYIYQAFQKYSQNFCTQTQE